MEHLGRPNLASQPGWGRKEGMEGVIWVEGTTSSSELGSCGLCTQSAHKMQKYATHSMSYQRLQGLALTRV